MSLAVMKSPARRGSTPITSLYYKCDDCGDVSHSQESLNLHRSVCHLPNKIRSADEGSEVIEKDPDATAKTDQIAESCECPKCGEHLLLLREHSFNCTLCDFHETDQSRFFVHLKEHYEPDAVLKFVEPGSVIIEQVIDGTSDLDGRIDCDNRKGSGDHEEPDLDEPDDRDDPEYAPDNDDSDDDDVEEMEKEISGRRFKTGKAKLSPVKVSSEQKQDSVKFTEDKKANDSKAVKPKLGISWDAPKEKGAPRKMSFVKTVTPVTPSKSAGSWTPLNSASRTLSADKTSSAPFKPVTIKEEPGSSPDKRVFSGKGGTKWVRFDDIKLESPYRQSDKFPARPYAPSLTKLLTGSAYSKGTSPPKKSIPTKRPRVSAESEPGSSEKPRTGEEGDEDAPKKKAPKKTKEKAPKPPPEKKVPVCGLCKRIFSTPTSLKVHMRIHTGEKNYTCDQCGRAFTQWSTCAQHIEAVHSGVKKYTCEFCGASFARNASLRLHRRIHTGEILHQCNICGKGFRCKSYLDRHRTFHTGEKRYKCEFCGKSFRTSTDMKRHRNSVHFGLGNVSLTVAKEMLITRMDGNYRMVQKQPTRSVVQRYVNEDSNSSEDSEEVLQATTIITGSAYEL